MKPVQHRVIHGSRFLGDREKVGEQGVKVWGIEHHVTMTYETRGALPTIFHLAWWSVFVDRH